MEQQLSLISELEKEQNLFYSELDVLTFMKNIKNSGGINNFLKENPYFHKDLFDKFISNKIKKYDFIHIMKLSYSPQYFYENYDVIFNNKIDIYMFDFFINKFKNDDIIVKNLLKNHLINDYVNNEINNELLKTKIRFMVREFQDKISSKEENLLYILNTEDKQEVLNKITNYEKFKEFKNITKELPKNILFKLNLFDNNEIFKIIKDLDDEGFDFNYKNENNENFLFYLNDLNKEIYEFLKNKNLDFNLSNKYGEQFYKNMNHLDHEIVLDLKNNNFDFNKKNILGLINLYYIIDTPEEFDFFKNKINADLKLLPIEQIKNNFSKALDKYNKNEWKYLLKMYNMKPSIAIILKQISEKIIIKDPEIKKKYYNNLKEKVEQFIEYILLSDDEFSNLDMSYNKSINKSTCQFSFYMNMQLEKSINKHKQKKEIIFKMLDIKCLNKDFFKEIFYNKNYFNIFCENKQMLTKNIEDLIEKKSYSLLYDLTWNKKFQKKAKESSEMIIKFLENYKDFIKKIDDVKKEALKYGAYKFVPTKVVEELNYAINGAKRNKLADYYAEIKFNQKEFNIFEKYLYSNDIENMRKIIEAKKTQKIDLSVNFVKEYCDDIKMFQLIAPNFDFTYDELVNKDNQFFSKYKNIVEKEIVKKGINIKEENKVKNNIYQIPQNSF